LQLYQRSSYMTHCDVLSSTKGDLTVHIVMFAAIPKGILQCTL
jgi:hypothetical protein